MKKKNNFTMLIRFFDKIEMTTIRHEKMRDPAERVLDCGGKRSAPPLSPGRNVHEKSLAVMHAQALSPLRSASAVQDANWISIRCTLAVLLLGLFTSTGSSQLAGSTTSPTVHSDLKLLQCGNLIYAGNKSSVCFADNFLKDVATQTSLKVNPKFCPVRLDAETLFDYPFCVMSGNENFSLTPKEREQLRKFLTSGGFLLASPGCSDEKWDKSFRQEIQVCFPEFPLQKIPLTHPIFSIVNPIPMLTEKHGKPVSLEGLEINGRLVLVYSKDGLNDVEHASGCCCCGGNEIKDPARVNVNVFSYAVLY